MKKKLLKPPANDSEILFLPDYGEFTSPICEKDRICVAHQPYFFNPGVSVKFLFLEGIPRCRKEIVFVDTDRVRVGVRVPSCSAWPKRLYLVNSEHVLCDFPTPERDVFSRFFTSIADELSAAFPDDSCGCLRHFVTFKEILERNAGRKLLKEVLAESFLEYYGIRRNYRFLSDFLKEEDYIEFINHICADAALFREIFNQALDDYGREFRFRFRNFPFPKLQEDELPFWIVEGGRRRRCYARDMGGKDRGKLAIFPRAATLTLFLRLYRADFFIHGIGGWNYEWVGDRVIERFFRAEPPPYAAASGTFLINNSKEREIPYFFFSPNKIKIKVWEHIRGQTFTLNSSKPT